MHKSVRVLNLAICRATVLANSYVPMGLNLVCLIVLSCFAGRQFADDIDLYTSEAVLASAAIPVSASPRARYKNQVYIGVFKPASAGRWQGNLKLYQVGTDKTSGNQILLDADEKPAMDKDGVFFASSSRSFWTSGADNPDGGSVVLGGVAQSLRQYVADHRINLTCTALCTNFESLAASNPNLNPADFGVNSDKALAQLLAWIKQGHGDVVHSQPALIDYGEQKGLYAFYGSNDGMLHAVKVGTAEKTEQADAKDGEEQWAFTAPQHFRRLGQLYQAHLNHKSDKKFYFFDGPVASYVRTDKEGELRSAIIIVTARRGGRLMLAMDVTDPQSPVMLWQKSNHDRGFEELGQTWSKPVIKPIRLSTGKKVNALFMGLGYDPADDVDANDPSSTRSQGRGLIVLDVLTGEIIWQKSDLTFSVPGDILVLDLDHNGFADRLYFGDSGGQLWRVSIADPIPSNWQIQRLLNLPNRQKFLNSPDVVRSSDGAYLAIIIGSGDSEKPFDRDTQNYLISYRDYCVESQDEGCTIPSASISDLQHIVVDKTKSSRKKMLRGWYLTLEYGEKIVTRAVTLGGKTSIASYKSCGQNSCGKFGEARIYSFNPFSFTEAQDHRRSPYYRAIRGAGILPSPVPFAIESPLCVEGKCPQAQPPISGVIFGPYIQATEGSPLHGPVKLWWHRQ